ncbi:hypothetical protein [Lentiprolixibacter aurantiacus]|uniref:Uncharacterized protein n=1 Tax=Lentiprolixibacter aurantiacus TaxID=2993939 RepID=A0AAE3SNR2_9FLAO|nr:hypothetical protein [Lentiprolixibacter aurantiacus]MCX2719909.1 hypothetical protein [Lentiprolixibacter aurantiacus]
MVIPAKRILVWALSVALFLMLPFVAMQYTNEVNWSLFDFLVMGGALLSMGLVYELIIRQSKQRTYRIAIGIGTAALFLLFWVNSAVGIIGNEAQAVNTLFWIVPAVILTGAGLSGLKARGMAQTMFIATVVQITVPAIGLFIWPPPTTSWSPGIFGVFMITAFFALMMLLSALLFRKVTRS